MTPARNPLRLAFVVINTGLITSAIMVVLVSILLGLGHLFEEGPPARFPVGLLLASAVAALFTFYIAVVPTLLGTAVLGLPAHALLQRLGLRRRWHYIATGQFLGGTLGATLFFYAKSTEASSLPQDQINNLWALYSISVYMILASGIAGGTFWHFLQKVPPAQPVGKSVR